MEINNYSNDFDSCFEVSSLLVNRPGLGQRGSRVCGSLGRSLENSHGGAEP